MILTVLKDQMLCLVPSHPVLNISNTREPQPARMLMHVLREQPLAFTSVFTERFWVALLLGLLLGPGQDSRAQLITRGPGE